MEWSKLIVLIERHTIAGAAAAAAEGGAAAVAATAWMLPTAEALFDEAIKCGWDGENGGGLCYTYGEDGKHLDKNKYYWAMAEMLGASGLLAVRTGKAHYREWYERGWRYALKHFVDVERGGWFPMVNADHVRTDTHAKPGHTGLPVKSYPSKTDYHALAACYEVHRALSAATEGSND